MDSIFSVRISEELKEKFVEIAQNQGINNKELMEQIIKSYELSNVKDNYNEVKSDIDELQHIITRIGDIYLNIIERNKAKNLECENLHLGKIKEYENKLENLLKIIEELKEKIKDYDKANNDLKKELQKSKEEYKVLEGNYLEVKELNLLLKEKNSDLLKEVELFKSNSEKLSLAEDEIKKLLKELNHFKMLANTVEKEKELLSRELVISKEDYDNKIKNTNQSYELSLKHLEENLKIAHSKELLEMQQRYSDQISQIKLKYEDKLTSLVREKEDDINKIKKILLEDKSSKS
jgi:hypothetical protein